MDGATTTQPKEERRTTKETTEILKMAAETISMVNLIAGNKPEVKKEIEKAAEMIVKVLNGMFVPANNKA